MKSTVDTFRMKSFLLGAALAMSGTSDISRAAEVAPQAFPATEKQVTRGPGGRILTNIGAWSPDGKWIVYDTRSEAGGEAFDGSRIERVNIDTGEVRTLYQSQHGAHCGVATFHPIEHKVAFILGPENPTPAWQYGFSHRQGVIVDVERPGVATRLDARDLKPPFTPGALRGGSHVHVWEGRGQWLSFTYNDALVEPDIRDVGVSVPGRAVRVKNDHPRNHDGEYFTVVATRTTANPRPGSDEIKRACEEGWVGTNGYLRTDGTRQARAIALQGQVVTAKGETISEVFVVDLPEDVTVEGDGPLAGSSTRRPCPPKGTAQRRLTFTEGRKHPGLQGPRHWLRSAPDGSRIAFLMKDDAGLVQLWTISPNGGIPTQLTRNPWSIASTFTWSPDGLQIAHGIDYSVAVTDARTGTTTRLTPRSPDPLSPRPEACVFSPDGRRIAYVRRPLTGDAKAHNQIFVLALND